MASGSDDLVQLLLKYVEWTEAVKRRNLFPRVMLTLGPIQAKELFELDARVKKLLRGAAGEPCD